MSEAVAIKSPAKLVYKRRISKSKRIRLWIKRIFLWFAILIILFPVFSIIASSNKSKSPSYKGKIVPLDNFSNTKSLAFNEVIK